MNIAPEIGSAVMVTVFVRAADKIAHGGGGAVGQNAHVRIDRPDVAGAATHIAFDLLLAGETEFTQQLARLDFVQGVVAAQKQQRELPVVRHHRTGSLHHLLRRDIQKSKDLLPCSWVRVTTSSSGLNSSCGISEAAGATA